MAGAARRLTRADCFWVLARDRALYPAPASGASADVSAVHFWPELTETAQGAADAPSNDEAAEASASFIRASDPASAPSSVGSSASSSVALPASSSVGSSASSTALPAPSSVGSSASSTALPAPSSVASSASSSIAASTSSYIAASPSSSKALPASSPIAPPASSSITLSSTAGSSTAPSSTAGSSTLRESLAVAPSTPIAEVELSGDHVWAWLSCAPQFSAVWVDDDDDGRILGVCVAVALNADGWARLSAGEVDEADLVPRHDPSDTRLLYRPGRDAAVALHVYHIERCLPADRGFSQRCFEHMGAAWRTLVAEERARAPGAAAPTFLGMSALVVSEAGERLFERRLGFREDAFRSPLHILTWADGARATVTVRLTTARAAAESRHEPALLASLTKSTGAAHVQPARFLRLVPETPSHVWRADWFGTA